MCDMALVSAGANKEDISNISHFLSFSTAFMPLLFDKGNTGLLKNLVTCCNKIKYEDLVEKLVQCS